MWPMRLAKNLTCMYSRSKRVLSNFENSGPGDFPRFLVTIVLLLGDGPSFYVCMHVFPCLSSWRLPYKFVFLSIHACVPISVVWGTAVNQNTNQHSLVTRRSIIIISNTKRVTVSLSRIWLLKSFWQPKVDTYAFLSVSPQVYLSTARSWQQATCLTTSPRKNTRKYLVTLTPSQAWLLSLGRPLVDTWPRVLVDFTWPAWGPSWVLCCP